MLALLLTLAAATPTSDDARLLTELIGNSAQRPNVDVLTGEDVRHAVDLEASRQSMGCDQSSCLAEIASAMGASEVLYGSLSPLGDEVILTLAMFNSATSKAGARALLRGPNMTTIVNQVDAAVKDMLDKSLDATKPTTLLVLDISLRNAPEKTQETAAAPAALLIGGGVTAGLGVVGVVVGVVFDNLALTAHNTAANPETTQKAAEQQLASRDQNAGVALGSYIIGGVLVVGGAAAALIGVME